MDVVRFHLNLAAYCRSRGVTVEFIPGWESRGNGQSADYVGGIIHHTATRSSDANPFPTRDILIKGRSDLPGPLCNWAGSWNGVLWVVAAHPANHAGASGGRSMGPLPVTTLFNRRVLGLEIDYAGNSPMSNAQYRSALVWSAGVITLL
jgi:hypothetical protein